MSFVNTQFNYTLNCKCLSCQYKVVSFANFFSYFSTVSVPTNLKYFNWKSSIYINLLLKTCELKFVYPWNNQAAFNSTVNVWHFINAILIGEIRRCFKANAHLSNWSRVTNSTGLSRLIFVRNIIDTYLDLSLTIMLQNSVLFSYFQN